MSPRLIREVSTFPQSPLLVYGAAKDLYMAADLTAVEQTLHVLKHACCVNVRKLIPIN